MIWRELNQKALQTLQAKVWKTQRKGDMSLSLCSCTTYSFLFLLPQDRCASEGTANLHTLYGADVWA